MLLIYQRCDLSMRVVGKTSIQVLQKVDDNRQSREVGKGEQDLNVRPGRPILVNIETALRTGSCPGA